VRPVADKAACQHRETARQASSARLISDSAGRRQRNGELVFDCGYSWCCPGDPLGFLTLTPSVDEAAEDHLGTNRLDVKSPCVELHNIAVSPSGGALDSGVQPHTVSTGHAARRSTVCVVEPNNISPAPGPALRPHDNHVGFCLYHLAPFVDPRWPGACQ